MATFHWADYAVCGLSLLIGPVLSIFFIVRGRGQRTTAQYLLGGQKLSAIAVGASIMASGFNAVFLLGGTAEVYYRGAIVFLTVLTFIPSMLVQCFIYVPVWRKHQVISAYEYLEQRYDSLFLRMWGSSLFIIKVIFFLSVVLYAPAMALSQVTGMNMHISIIVSGSLCTLYTVLGGLKAVVWTDTVQAFIMLAGMLVLVIVGTINVGGFAHVFYTAMEHGRLNFNNWSMDPCERHSVWGLSIGLFFVWNTSHLADQTYVQRYHSVRSLKDARMAIWWSVIIGLMCFVTVTLAGIVCFVYFVDCDPLVNGDITKGDQLLPFFFMSLLSSYPGVPGLFIASIFAAALSTVSSIINSLAAIVLEDFIKPIRRLLGCPLPVSQEHVVAKVLSGVFGVLSIGLSYLAPLLGDAIIQVPPTVFGALGPPLFSLFFCGFFVPFTNKWGAFLGSLTGVVFGLWRGIGGVMYGRSATEDNLPVGSCSNNITSSNDTFSIWSTESHPWYTESMETTYTVEEAHVVSGLTSLYSVSYTWSGVLGILVSVTSVLLFSAVIRCCGSSPNTPQEQAVTDQFEYIKINKDNLGNNHDSRVAAETHAQVVDKLVKHFE